MRWGMKDMNIKELASLLQKRIDIRMKDFMVNYDKLKIGINNDHETNRNHYRKTAKDHKPSG